MKTALQNFKKFTLALCIAAGLSVFAVHAEQEYMPENADSVLNNLSSTSARSNGATVPYRPVATVVPELAQLVVYYPQGSAPAAIYVDSELQSALLPGEFTVFCVASGAHTIESYFNDQPLYHGKQNPSRQLNTSGALTYFVQINPGVSGNTASLVERGQAESALASLYKHSRIVNRASQVKTCDYVNSGGVVLIQEQVMFRFAKGNAAGLLPESRSKLENVAGFIKQANNVSEVQIVGYTDAVGSREANQRLSETRANTIRSLLINQNVNPNMLNNTVGRGVAQSAEGCGTKPSQRSFGCNVNSRRVDIVVKGN